MGKVISGGGNETLVISMGLEKDVLALILSYLISVAKSADLCLEENMQAAKCCRFASALCAFS